MTEADYIDATNLAKIRIAKNVIYDCLFDVLDDWTLNDKQEEIISLISSLEESISSKINKDMTNE
jgi:hypothetical protein